MVGGDIIAATQTVEMIRDTFHGNSYRSALEAAVRCCVSCRQMYLRVLIGKVLFSD